MIKLASWNVNSLKVRLEQVLAWLESSTVDVLALQETKLVDELFPADIFRQRGYHVVYSGQKTYNGVAVISKIPVEEVVTDIPGLNDPQRRILAVTINGVRVINLYVPNGSEVGSDKYQYKLQWLQHVRTYLEAQLRIYPKLAVVGDFNIAPDDLDVHDPQQWEGCVLVSSPERQVLAEFLALGLQDSFRVLNAQTQAFSWWDYRAARFRRNQGVRIDLILLSQALMSHCVSSQIDVEPRRLERPSDHAPVWVAFNP